MRPEQQLNLAELNDIQGVVAYLNGRRPGDLSFDVTVFDPNGDKVGEIRQSGGPEDHQFFYPAPTN